MHHNLPVSRARSGKAIAEQVDLSDVSVVIPARNEALALESVLDQIPQDVGEVIVVDGVSSDATMSIASSWGSNVQALARTRFGKGNALACGFAQASGEIVVALDADGSADPADLRIVVDGLRNGADFVKGFRSTRDGAVRSLGSRIVTEAFNARLGTAMSDVCCGFIGVRRDVIPLLGLEWREADGRMREGDGFEIDALLLGRAVLRGVSVSEVEISNRSRIGGTSKLRPIADGMRILRAISLLR